MPSQCNLLFSLPELKHLLKHPEKILLSEISSRPREGVEKGEKVVEVHVLDSAGVT